MALHTDSTAALTVDIIIVNWNSGQQLRDCLSSLRDVRQEHVRLERVVVVDNASTDDSLSLISAIPLPLRIIRNVENRGFAAACNQGARNSASDFVLFLNPDTRLTPSCLDQVAEFMGSKEGAQVGICGVQLADAEGNISRSCSRFPTVWRLASKSLGLDSLLPRLFPGTSMGDWTHDSNREVDQVIGAFFWVRRSLFEALEGFDERFFVYYEEVDFSFRARSRRWTSFYLSKARAFHKGGGCSEQVRAQRLYYSLRSRLLFARKHFGRLAAGITTFATLAIEPLTRLLFSLVSPSGNSVHETLAAYRLLWSDLTACPRLEAAAKRS